MKKAMLAPLCSALVIPGLGQVINQHLKKGILMLAADFVFIMAFSVEMYQIVSGIVESGVVTNDEPKMIMEWMSAGNYSDLVFLVTAFGVLWVYSVVDAFFGGRKMDKIENGVEKVS